MSILGLVSGKTFDDEGFHSLNNRREVFHNYPNGGATLTGLLSLMEDEPTDTPQFGWFEKRYADVRTTVADGAAPINGTGTNTSAGSPVDIAAGTTYRLFVEDSSDFKVTHQIWIQNAPVTGGVADLHGTVVEIVSATAIEVRMTRSVDAVINVDNASTALVGNPVRVIGTTNAEGASSGVSRMTVPINPGNYTQIFRDPIYFTSTTLKIPADFDKTGAYKENAKDVSIEHLTNIEKAFLFGNRNTQYVTHSSGEQVPVRTTGGILWFLEEYEKAAGGSFGYRPNGSALTSNDDPDKRIINVTSGTTTYASWLEWIERVFRRTNNKAFEKLVLCGNGAMGAVNQLIELGLVTQNKDMSRGDTYSMAVTTVETIYGTLHFKTHPLFTEDPGLRYSMLITDVGELKYRALNDRDTTLLDNRQNNDEDGRKDEWLTECGLECRYPESHMFIHNLQTITKE